jgi:hypothetical protein
MDRKQSEDIARIMDQIMPKAKIITHPIHQIIPNITHQIRLEFLMIISKTAQSFQEISPNKSKSMDLIMPTK